MASLRPKVRLIARPLALSCVAIFTLAAGQLQAKCDPAVPPIIPEDPEISAAAMAQVKEQVQTYMADAKTYIGCVKRKKKRNQAIDEMRVVAADYNVLIQFYREYAAEQQALEE